MAYEIPGFVLGTQVAGANLTAAQYRFVKLQDGDGIHLATAAEQPLGTLNNAPADLGVCEIVTSGVAKVKCDGTIAEGGRVEVGASSGAAALASGFAAGIALEDGVVNQVISVRLGDYGK